jgi:DNA-binding transcriptional LysR family regulator
VINIDLKLLAVINELHRTRNVSHAAENLQLSQSTTSMRLARLRKYFGDPLFVRTSTGMEPTPRATELVEILNQAENLLQRALEHQITFEPAISDRVFHICARDIGQLRLLPRLMRRLKEIAPAVRIDVQNISENTPKQLESGALDLAVGFFPLMGAGFCQQKLFKERFVCAVRKDHPRIKSELTLAQFESEVHLAVTTPGTSHGIVERTLDTRKIRRKVGLRVPSVLGISAIIPETDFLVIIPEQMGLILAKSRSIKLFNLPFSVPTYLIKQHWHERYSQDPANKWLRGVISDLFLNR